MTELIWEGKYKKGKKSAPVRIALPFQTIETVNESAQDRQKTLSIFTHGSIKDWRNRLIWGDKKYVLPSLLPEFAGKVNLIYIDPPFDTGADFSFKAKVAEDFESGKDGAFEFTKSPSVIEQKAYRDTWGKGLDSYLHWFHETALLLRELLADDGSIYVHLDWHIGHYAKIILDEIFGYDNFRNEVVWRYRRWPANSKDFQRMHDVILRYSKERNGFIWNQLFESKSASTLKAFGNTKLTTEITARGTVKKVRTNEISKGTNMSDVWEIPLIQGSASHERVNYPTQKPEALIERIIQASSNKDDLVLDCFCGSGTTAAVAEKLNRRWIACDLGRFAIHTTRKRLLQIADVKPFIVQNLGKYERQQWMSAEFEDKETRSVQEKAYHNFLLDLYHAEPIEGYIWLHGIKEGRVVHIGNVDSPVSVGDVKSIVQEFWKNIGKAMKSKVNGVDILGWDFAFDINEITKQFSAANNVDIKFKKIPREVLEKKAVEQGDIKFFELGSLDVTTKKKENEVVLTLKDFIIPLDDVPEEIRKTITHWSQFVDYWAIDWNFRDDTFHNEWQSYRTKKVPKLELNATHEYETKGKYTILVKVIDILGNDTTKAIKIQIP